MAKKRILVLIAAVGILVSSIFTGCGNNTKQTSDNSSKSSVNKDVKMLTSVTGGKDDTGMKAWVQELDKETGLNVTMDKPADYNNTLMQKLQAGEKYDLIYLTQDQLPYLVQQGAVKDITDLVKNSKILSDPSVVPQSEWDAIKIGGKIYAGFNKREVERVVNVNSIIATKAGVDVNNIDPTLDGYYNVFKKMKASDKDTGFYPFNTDFTQVYDLQPWFSSLGLKGGIVLDANGKKTVPWSSDASAPVWDWFRKLYSEGLMDKDAVTDATKDLRNKFQSEKTGVDVDWAAWTGLYNANAGSQYPDQFKAVPLPGTKTPDGSYMLTKGNASLWAIPANAQNVEGAMKILEFFATQKGGELLTVGAPGYDYNIENGKYVLTDAGKKAAGDHGAPVPIDSQFKNPIGLNPGFEDALKFIQYSSIEQSLPETSKYTQIFAKHAVQIVRGDVSVSQGLSNMRNELKQANVID